MAKTGVWIVGDQSYRAATSLAGITKQTPIVFVESRRFCERRPYHWQKLVLILSVMRHFAAELLASGYDVHYFKLAEDFTSALKEFVQKTAIDRLRVMEFNDADRVAAVPKIVAAIGCPIDVVENNQFLASHDDFAGWASGRQSLTMEYWYRDLRRKLGVLIEKDGKPVGGSWNFDKLNREGRIAVGEKLPEPFAITPDEITLKVIEDVQAAFGGECFGATSADVMRKAFIWPVTPADATAALREFLQKRLERFGPYEDTMTQKSWSLWHSHLSVAMNCGLLHPKQIIDETMAYALPRVTRGEIPLNSVEGFVRQVIGWREFIRGVYWREIRKAGMVPYPHRNELEAHHPLPAFYWTGETDMACMAHSLEPVFRFGYAHHISRLMVMSNFALLHGISPQAVNEWFIYAFADGYEWVTTPNVIGMSLYADGGIVATKPYAAGGAYIHKMSDHCSRCRYDPKQSTGSRACPFTRAYWPFIAKHRRRLESNQRTSLAVRGLDRIDDLSERTRQTKTYLESLPVYQVTIQPKAAK